MGTPEFDSAVERKIYEVTREAENQVGGFDFACVINSYYRAYKTDDDGNRVVDSEKTASYRTLKTYDSIIVKGTNIEDGKVIY